MRIRRRKRSESLKDWRANAPLRAVSFQPAMTDDGVDVEGVLQLHLEHRLVRRLLSRFLSQGFIVGPVARLGRHRARRPAARRPARPAGALWAGRGAAA